MMYRTKVTMNYVEIMQILQAKGNVQDLKRLSEAINLRRQRMWRKLEGTTNKCNNLILVTQDVT